MTLAAVGDKLTVCLEAMKSASSSAVVSGKQFGTWLGHQIVWLFNSALNGLTQFWHFVSSNVQSAWAGASPHLANFAKLLISSTGLTIIAGISAVFLGKMALGEVGDDDKKKKYTCLALCIVSAVAVGVFATHAGLFAAII